MINQILLVLLGLAVGSFLNVIALRYKAGGWLFTPDIISGRSHCPHCKQTLRWFELLPLVSFIWLGGKCRHCHKNISLQYPLVEMIGGLIFLLVPLFPPAAGATPVWVLAILTLLLITLIDARISIIPDQLNVFLGILGVALIAMKDIGNFAVWIDPLVGAGFGLALFGLIILFSRGNGMGMGDLKLGIALGFLLGWPKIIIAAMAAFIIGALWSVLALAFGRKKMKDKIPFGPFLSLGALFALYFADLILRAYFYGF